MSIFHHRDPIREFFSSQYCLYNYEQSSDGIDRRIERKNRFGLHTKYRLRSIEELRYYTVLVI